MSLSMAYYIKRTPIPLTFAVEPSKNQRYTKGPFLYTLRMRKLVTNNSLVEFFSPQNGFGSQGITINSFLCAPLVTMVKSFPRIKLRSGFLRCAQKLEELRYMI